MRFLISRASDLQRSNNPPCEGAKKSRGWWYIDVASIEQLMELAERTGHRLVVGTDWAGTKTITIYDDCLE